jgi:hypothetical protein
MYQHRKKPKYLIAFVARVTLSAITYYQVKESRICRLLIVCDVTLYLCHFFGIQAYTFDDKTYLKVKEGIGEHHWVRHYQQKEVFSVYKTCHFFYTYFFHNGAYSVCSRNFDFYATSSSRNKFSSEQNKLHIWKLIFNIKKRPLCVLFT